MTLLRTLTSVALAFALASCGGDRTETDISGEKVALPTIGSSGGALSSVEAKRLFGAKSFASAQTPAAYGSYSKGYTVPDVGRILRGIDTPGVDIDNFLDVTPIISDNRELGLEVDRGPLDASVTYFWSSSDFGQRLVLNADGIFDVRREATEIEGIEINVGVETPVEGLKLGIGYSDLAGRVDTDGDGVVDDELDGANISPDRFNLSADYASGPFSALVQGQFYLSRSFEGQPASAAFEGYTIVNALVRYETGFGAFSLAAGNLLDEYYISYDSDTVRTTDDTRFFAGRGRTVTLGWDWRF